MSRAWVGRLPCSAADSILLTSCSPHPSQENPKQKDPQREAGQSPCSSLDRHPHSYPHPRQDVSKGRLHFSKPGLSRRCSHDGLRSVPSPSCLHRFKFHSPPPFPWSHPPSQGQRKSPRGRWLPCSFHPCWDKCPGRKAVTTNAPAGLARGNPSVNIYCTL